MPPSPCAMRVCGVFNIQETRGFSAIIAKAYNVEWKLPVRNTPLGEPLV